jgi:hypothetical protein
MASLASGFWDELLDVGLEMRKDYTVFIGTANRYVDAGYLTHPGCEKMSIPRALHIIDCSNAAELTDSDLLLDLFNDYF